MNFQTLNRKRSMSYKWEEAKSLSKDIDIIPFSVADSDYQTAPCVIKKLNERVNHGAFGYPKADGPYKDAFISWAEKTYQIKLEKNWILAGEKILSAIIHILETFTKVDDDIVIQTPVYHMFKHLIEANNRKSIENELVIKDHAYHMDLNDLEERFKQGAKTILFCNPHNPIGKVWTYDELNDFVLLCKKYEVNIISDEIHADIIMPDHKFHTLAKWFDVYEQIFVLYAPSKSFNIAGLKMSNLVTPHQKNYDLIKATFDKHLIFGPNLLAQTALIAAYREGESWIKAQNKHIHANFEYLKHMLNKNHPNVMIYPLEGTYLAWLDFSYLKLSSKALNDIFHTYGIHLSEGLTFGSKSDGFMRFNLACSKEQLKEGLARMDQALKSI